MLYSMAGWRGLQIKNMWSFTAITEVISLAILQILVLFFLTVMPTNTSCITSFTECSTSSTLPVMIVVKSHASERKLITCI